MIKTHEHPATHHDHPVTHDGSHKETQEDREAEARSKQQMGDMEAELEAYLEPIKARFRDQYRDFRASLGHPPKIAPQPNNGSSGYCLECGKVVAMGQNYVCRDHIRVG